MLRLILKDGDVIIGRTKEELEINMKNDSTFTSGETIKEYKNGVAERLFNLYGYVIDVNNFIDSLIKYNLARIEEIPEA